MSKPKDNEFETYYIPPNFIEGSTLFGGLFKLRNAIEAGILAVGAGLPVFLLDIPLTTRIIILCLTALPWAFWGCSAYRENACRPLSLLSSNG